MPRRPLLWSAIAFAAGILSHPSTTAICADASIAAVCFAGAVLMIRAASSRTGAQVAMVLLAAGFSMTGRVAGHASSFTGPGDVGRILALHPVPLAEGAGLEGRLVRASVIERGGMGPATSTLEMLVDLTGMTLRGMHRPVRGRVRLRMPAPGSVLTLPRRGASLSVWARVFAPHSARNPGAFDYARYLEARGIDATGFVKSIRLLSVREPAVLSVRTALLRRVDRLRARLLAAIDRTFPLTPSGRRAAAVASALLLGKRDGLEPADNLLLQEAGLSHLLAVSGFNVAVLTGALLLVLRLAGVGTRMRCATAIPVLFLYLLLNQEESSVARAVVMAVVYLAGRILWRRCDAINGLALAALILLARDPACIHDAGFQLTFLATLALVVTLPAWESTRPEVRRGSRLRGRLRRWIRGTAAATLAATAVTLPLTALHFNRVAPGAVPANVIASPMMAAAFVGTLCLEAAGPLQGPLPPMIASVVTRLVDGSFAVARLVTRVPAMTYRRPTPSAPLIVLYSLGIAALSSRSCPRRGVVALSMAADSAGHAGPLDTRAAPAGLRLTAFDVGQGESLLVETPGRSRLLVDAGGASRGGFDVGERIVSRALWSIGIARVDVVAVTHPDDDHAGGAAALVKNFGPREVWLPAGASAWRTRPDIARLLDAAAACGARVRVLQRGDEARLGLALVRVLHPPPGSPAGVSSNERSLVLMLESCGRRALLMADAGTLTEKDLSGADLAADLLKVGHHGSRSATSASFLGHVRPKVAVVSCGAGNRFGHPHRIVIERLAALPARICRTDRQGAVSVTLKKTGTVLSASCASRGRGSEALDGEGTRDDAEDQDQQGHEGEDDPAP